jgi:hypothetical protein
LLLLCLRWKVLEVTQLEDRPLIEFQMFTESAVYDTFEYKELGVRMMWRGWWSVWVRLWKVNVDVQATLGCVAIVLEF